MYCNSEHDKTDLLKKEPLFPTPSRSNKWENTEHLETLKEEYPQHFSSSQKGFENVAEYEVSPEILLRKIQQLNPEFYTEMVELIRNTVNSLEKEARAKKYSGDKERDPHYFSSSQKNIPDSIRKLGRLTTEEDFTSQVTNAMTHEINPTIEYLANKAFCQVFEDVKNVLEDAVCQGSIKGEPQDVYNFIAHDAASQVKKFLVNTLNKQT